MIRSTALETRRRHERLDAKTLDNLFRRRIEEGAKCSPFVSAAILQIVKDVFPLQPDDLGKQLDIGQIKLLVAAAHVLQWLEGSAGAEVDRVTHDA